MEIVKVPQKLNSQHPTDIFIKDNSGGKHHFAVEDNLDATHHEIIIIINP
jgi:hypothetical protein